MNYIISEGSLEILSISRIIKDSLGGIKRTKRGNLVMAVPIIRGRANRRLNYHYLHQQSQTCSDHDCRLQTGGFPDDD